MRRRRQCSRTAPGGTATSAGGGAQAEVDAGNPARAPAEADGDERQGPTWKTVAKPAPVGRRSGQTHRPTSQAWGSEPAGPAPGPDRAPRRAPGSGSASKAGKGTTPAWIRMEPPKIAGDAGSGLPEVLGRPRRRGGGRTDLAGRGDDEAEDHAGGRVTLQARSGGGQDRNPSSAWARTTQTVQAEADRSARRRRCGWQRRRRGRLPVAEGGRRQAA